MKQNSSNVRIAYLRKRIVAWGRRNYAEYPWRSTPNRWHALVAEIMLQRTRADQVVGPYQDFVRRYPDPGVYINASDPGVFDSLGLISREKRLKDLALALQGCDIPDDRDSLLALPGIGTYIAAAFRSFHCGIRDVIIDSNVVRLYGRVFGFEYDGETRRKAWMLDLANRITPARIHRDFNYAVIDFTRSICKPRPVCGHCGLNSQCAYYTAKCES